MQNKRKNTNFSFFIIFFLIALMIFFFSSPKKEDKAQYSEIVTKFKNHQVTEFTLDLSNGKLTYRLRNDTEGDAMHEYTVPDVDIFLAEIEEYVKQYDEEHPYDPMKREIKPRTNVWLMLLGMLPYLLLIGGIVFIFILMNKQGGQIGSVSKARTKQGFESDKTATFADVAGADEEKEELQEIVEFLKNPAKFNKLGGKIPKGVLLVGPPGTGKTLLGRAVAGEAGVPFYSISGSDFVELYVGVGAARVRDLFDKAKKTRPSIIFIDEIDAVGRQRGTGLGGGHDEREQTLNQLLVELDGFVGNEGVIVFAATNRADVLDQALLRPGRFDRTVYVGLPDVKGREEILHVHSKNKPFGPDVDFKTIAKTTPGFTGADLENLLNEAALLAARRDKKAITQDEIEEASIKVMMGPEKKSKVITEKERRLTAYHEAGHAVAHYYVTPDERIHQVSIIPRGQALGFTMPRPVEDKNLVTRGDMINEIITLLGGRVAEKLVLDDISTGASSDLKRATSIARAMVMRYGFSENIGPIVYEEHEEVFLGRDFTSSRSYSEQVASDIDKEVRSIIENAMEQCTEVLNKHRKKLDEVTDALLALDTIDDEEFDAIMNGTFKLPEEKSK